MATKKTTKKEAKTVPVEKVEEIAEQAQQQQQAPQQPTTYNHTNTNENVQSNTMAAGTFTGNGGVLTVNGSGTSVFAGDVSIGGILTLAQDATVTMDFSANNATIDGNLTVNGNTTLNELVKVYSATTKAANRTCLKCGMQKSHDPHSFRFPQQIGRASCRERV